MPRTEKYPKYVQKTNKDHKCQNCSGIIPKGSIWVRYKNLFTGKRGYYHPDPKDCEPYLEVMWQKAREFNDAARQKKEPR